jgi:hypothetical protein
MNRPNIPDTGTSSHFSSGSTTCTDDDAASVDIVGTASFSREHSPSLLLLSSLALLDNCMGRTELIAFSRPLTVHAHKLRRPNGSLP